MQPVVDHRPEFPHVLYKRASLVAEQKADVAFFLPGKVIDQQDWQASRKTFRDNQPASLGHQNIRCHHPLRHILFKIPHFHREVKMAVNQLLVKLVIPAGNHHSLNRRRKAFQHLEIILQVANPIASNE